MKFKVGDRVVCLSVKDSAIGRNPYATITEVTKVYYILDFDGTDYKDMSRLINNNKLRKLTKLEKALK